MQRKSISKEIEEGYCFRFPNSYKRFIDDISKIENPEIIDHGEDEIEDIIVNIDYQDELDSHEIEENYKKFGIRETDNGLRNLLNLV